MNDRIAHGLGIGLARQQIQQAIFRQIVPPVIMNGEPCIQEAVVPYLVLNKLSGEVIIPEYSIIRHELHDGPICLRSSTLPVFLYKHATLELCLLHASIAKGSHCEALTEGVDCFGTHTIQPNTLLESLAVILGASVNLTNYIDNLAQRDATAIIAHADCTILDEYVDALAMSHGKLVD